jgi:hypothetical protein
MHVAGPVPSRATILARAEGLQRRIAAGECPYPDEAGRANDAFIARYSASRSDDPKGIERGAWVPSALKAAGLFGVLATGAFCLTCAPSAVHVGVAFVGGAAARALFRMGRNVGLEVAARHKLADQVRAWQGWPSDAPPSVSGPVAPLTATSLRAATRDFSREVEGFPYAPELRGAHGRLMERVAREGIGTTTPTAGGPRPGPGPGSARVGPRRVPEIVVSAGHVYSVVACGATAGLVAAGHPLLAAGAFGSFLAREGVRLIEIRRGQRPAGLGPHALEYWERAARPAEGNDDAVH